MENLISKKIIGAAIEVHKTLGGPGLLESVYEEALCMEFTLRNIKFQRQVPVPILYKGQKVKNPLFLDLLVEDKVIIEVKSVDKKIPIFHTQVLTYLRLTGLKLGLIINFGEATIVKGLIRVVNDL